MKTKNSVKVSRGRKSHCLPGQWWAEWGIAEEMLMIQVSSAIQCFDRSLNS
jgi:hypothetical protein